MSRFEEKRPVYLKIILERSSNRSIQLSLAISRNSLESSKAGK